MKVSVITLGCDKNTVDSERYVAQLADRGATYTRDLDEADVVLVNTCGFIDAAKKESIDAMVEAGRLKTEGKAKRLVVAGCLVERYRDELKAAFKLIYTSGLNTSQALAQASKKNWGVLAREFFDFIANAKKHGICAYRGSDRKRAD